jgi:hypothetical protein
MSKRPGGRDVCYGVPGWRLLHSRYCARMQLPHGRYPWLADQRWSRYPLMLGPQAFGLDVRPRSRGAVRGRAGRESSEFVGRPGTGRRRVPLPPRSFERRRNSPACDRNSWLHSPIGSNRLSGPSRRRPHAWDRRRRLGLEGHRGKPPVQPPGSHQARNLSTCITAGLTATAERQQAIEAAVGRQSSPCRR